MQDGLPQLATRDKVSPPDLPGPVPGISFAAKKTDFECSRDGISGAVRTTLAERRSRAREARTLHLQSYALFPRNVFDRRWEAVQVSTPGQWRRPCLSGWSRPNERSMLLPLRASPIPCLTCTATRGLARRKKPALAQTTKRRAWRRAFPNPLKAKPGVTVPSSLLRSARAMG